MTLIVIKFGSCVNGIRSVNTLANEANNSNALSSGPKHNNHNIGTVPDMEGELTPISASGLQVLGANSQGTHLKSNRENGYQYSPKVTQTAPAMRRAIASPDARFKY